LIHNDVEAQARKIQRLDFVLAGAQKSGTTALHYFLGKHPNITMGDQQEIHFFDNDALLLPGPITRNYINIIRPLVPQPSLVIARQVTFITNARRKGFGNTIRRPDY